jgi:hypothetical protein
MLTEKANTAQNAVAEAATALEKLQSDKSLKEQELVEMNSERKGLVKQIKEAEAKLTVSWRRYDTGRFCSSNSRPLASKRTECEPSSLAPVKRLTRRGPARRRAPLRTPYWIVLLV